MSHQYKQQASRVRAYFAQRVVPLLPGIIYAVKIDKAAFVLKHPRRQLEVDAVLSSVLAVLTFIPLIPHLYIHIV